MGFIKTTDFYVSIAFSLLMVGGCTQSAKHEIASPFQPWHHGADKVEVKTQWTWEYMNSRPPRRVGNFNRDWTFNYLPSSEVDTAVVSPAFNDGRWEAIALPHTWQTYETTRELHPYIHDASERDDPYWWKGWGYYRKHFSVDQSMMGKKVFLELNGVQKYCRVYLNGKFIGDHKGGYNSFSLELTPFIQMDKDNVLVIAVNNYRRDKYRIPPMTAGNFDVYGGIYRDVRLVMKSNVYFPYQGSYKHQGGTFVTTPHVDAHQALVRIKTYVKNGSGQPQHCRLVSTIISPQGKTLQKLDTEADVPADSIFAFDQDSAPVKNPLLWSPETPNLYKVRSEVYVGENLKDVVESPLGFRWFHWNFDNNHLYLNGKEINIKGINKHQEYPWLGDAIPKWVIVEDMKDIKFGMGHNFMRAAHYPNDPLLYDLADQFGIIMVEEVPNIKNIDFSEEVQEQNVHEMIRRDRNHPSIFFWSMGNETSDGADSKWAVEEDTTRIIHARKAKDTGDFVQHTDKNLDLENLLRVTISGWFTKDDVVQKIDANPEDGQYAGTELWQHQMAMVRGGSVRGVLGDNCVGWIYEDHGADREYKNAPLKHVNPKGWVDNYRIPKYIYFLTKAMYTEKPMVFVMPHYWREKYLGSRRPFIVDSNCDTVELFVNGKSYGKKFPRKAPFRSVTFDSILVEKGNLLVRGARGGTAVEQQLKMAGKPARIVLAAKHEKLYADRAGIAIVTAYALDENGNFVLDAENTLKWQVEGPAKLVGSAEYKTDLRQLEAFEGTGYHVMPVSNVIRTTGEPGTIKVTVSAEGMESGAIKLESFAPPNDALIGVREHTLSEEGRGAVTKNEAFKEQVHFSESIKPIRGNRDFSSTSAGDLPLEIQRYIQSENAGLQPDQKGFPLLLKQLAAAVQRSQGTLVADDYNFLTNQYNYLATLEEAIDAGNLHVYYADSLKKYYADQLLLKNQQIDLDENIAMIQGVPKNHVPLYILKPDKENPAGKMLDVYVTKTYKVYANSPMEGLLYVYPDLAKLDKAQRDKAFQYIADISPYVTYDPLQEKFLLDHEVPLIVPGLDFLKQLK